VESSSTAIREVRHGERDRRALLLTGGSAWEARLSYRLSTRACSLLRTPAATSATNELDQLLEDDGHRFTHDVDTAAGAAGVEQLGQGRL